MPRKPLQWIVYSADDDGQSPESPNSNDFGVSHEAAAVHVSVNPLLNDWLDTATIPLSLKQDPCDAAVAFFFRHHVGNASNRQSRMGFNHIWQPMYHRSAMGSALRTATAAVCVNISMLWSSKGCDTHLPRSLFSDAVAITRKTMLSPALNTSNELLMTILAFDLYDDLLLYYRPGPVVHGAHKKGLLAMVKHRGAVNHQSEVHKRMLDTVRHSVLEHYLSNRLSFSDDELEMFRHAAARSLPVNSLDLASMQLAKVQGHMWAFRAIRHTKTPRERRICYEAFIADAIHVTQLFLSWDLFTIRSEWKAFSVPRKSLLPSIVSAGVYGDECFVWEELSLGNLWNTHAVRSIQALQLIRQALADEPTLLLDRPYRELLTKTDAEIQKHVDDVLASIPFHVGDTVRVTNPINCDTVNYPFAIVKDAETGLDVKAPHPLTEHAAKATASGGWYLYPKLVSLYRFAEPEDDAVPIVLRNGQLDWIKGQVTRLQRLFMYVDPPWFKRLQKTAEQSAR